MHPSSYAIDSMLEAVETDTQQHLEVLVLTCDLPSHPYAAAKLAIVLAEGGHHVTLAAPEGPALNRVKSETRATNVKCVQAGTVSTVKHLNERHVTDPHSWSTLWDALKDPFPLAAAVNGMADTQDGMYASIQQLIKHGGYDIVIPIHSTSITVCDAVEASGEDVPVVNFSSLPYEPAMYLGERTTWNMPKSLSAIPHVSTYSATPPRNIFHYLIQIFWKLLDAYLTARAWARSAKANNERRARRGLEPIPDGWRGYAFKYPTISFGGVEPFLDSNSVVAPQVYAIGGLDVGNNKTEIEGDLRQWLDRAENGIVYAGFGTGTVLSNFEAAAITGDLVHGLAADPSLPRVLFALKASEQKRLRKVFDEAVGAGPTVESDEHLEYLDGHLRIQHDVPQASLLTSGQVKVFLSHMGMGGFTEGIKAGVPFITYPSGCDQWFNAQRAIDAGIGVEAPYGLEGIGALVKEVLRDDKLAAAAHDTAKQMEYVHGEQRALLAIESIVKLHAQKKEITKERSVMAGKKVVAKSSFSLSQEDESQVRHRRPSTVAARAA